MPKINQSGVSQILVLVILVVGLLGGLWLLQNGRTVLKPKASENAFSPPEIDRRACSGSYIVGEETGIGKRAILVRLSTTLKNSETENDCTEFKTDVGDYNTYFCPDIKCYFDNNVNRWIFKHGGVENNNGKCDYDFKQMNSQAACEATRKQEADDKFYGLIPPEKNNNNAVCRPDQRNEQYCTVCNSTGDGWQLIGSDWGSFETNPTQWCGCAKQYSYSTEGKAYNKENYSKCF